MRGVSRLLSSQVGLCSMERFLLVSYFCVIVGLILPFKISDKESKSMLPITNLSAIKSVMHYSVAVSRFVS
jgi:hypothetical protein